MADVVDAERPLVFASRSRVAIGATLVVSVAFILGAIELRTRFPSSYTWTDLLVSYEGGFLRRGLLGEIAFLLDPVIGADVSVTAFLLAAYLTVNTTIVLLVLRQPSLPGLLCIVSPGLLLFPVWDFEAFGRKDIVILLAFVLSLLFIRHARSPRGCLWALVAVYSVAGLIHETAWIYFVTAIAAMLLLRRDDPSTQVRIALVAGACLLTWAAVTIGFDGTAMEAELMMDAWRDRYPAAYGQPGAAGLLGVPFPLSVNIMVHEQRHVVTTSGYVVAFLLTGAPVAWWARERWMSVQVQRRALISAIGFSAMLGAFLVAADWGRYTYLLWMHVLLVLCFLPTSRESSRHRRIALVPAWLLVMLYATTWSVLHWAPGPSSPLRPGPALWWLGISE